MRLIALIVLVSFSLAACTQTLSWKTITSESRPPADVDPGKLIGKNVRFLLADSSTVYMRVSEVSERQVRGYQSNPYLPADTRVVNLRDVLRIERESAGLRPKKATLVITGVVVGLLILFAVGMSQPGAIGLSE